MNRILIKRGKAIPPNGTLMDGEVGYVESLNSLCIGKQGTNQIISPCTTFNITLLATGWVAEGDYFKQIITDSKITGDNSSFIINPIETDRDAYIEAKVYGNDITDQGMPFVCSNKPSTDITVKITKIIAI